MQASKRNLTIEDQECRCALPGETTISYQLNACRTNTSPSYEGNIYVSMNVLCVALSATPCVFSAQSTRPTAPVHVETKVTFEQKHSPCRSLCGSRFVQVHHFPSPVSILGEAAASLLTQRGRT